MRLRWGGLPYLKNDEHQTLNSSLGMLVRGDLEPRFYHYGSLMLYVGYATEWFTSLLLIGKPENAPQALAKVEDIRLGQPGYPWLLSHPDLLKGARLPVAFLGTMTVVLTYFLGKRLAGPMAGILASLVIALSPLSIEFSGVFGVDVPVAFFVTCCVFSAVEFRATGDHRWWWLSLLCTGFAASCKYNSAIVGVVPILAWIQLRIEAQQDLDPWQLLWVPVLPCVGFLGTSPYALLAPSDFLLQAGFEVRHYRHMGHNGFDIEPGLGHAGTIVWDLAVAMYLVPILAAVLLLVTFSRWRQYWFVWVYPCMHVALMSGMVINQPRNHIGLQVFIAVAAGASTVWGYEWLRSNERLSRWGAALMGSPWLLWLTASLIAAVQATYVNISPDGRTLAIDQLAQAGGAVGVPTELHVHPVDRARSSRDFVVAPLHLLLCRDDLDGVLVPDSFFSRNDHGTARQLNQLLDVESPAPEGSWPPPTGTMVVDHPDTHPRVALRRDLQRPARCPVELSELTVSRDFPIVDGMREMRWNGWMRTKAVPAKAVVWTVSATSAGGVHARAALSAIVGGKVVASKEIVVEPGNAMEIGLTLDGEAAAAQFEIRFVNDGKHGDDERDLFVHSVHLLSGN